MYPDRDTLSNVPLPRSGHIRARDQRMVESGEPEAVKTLPVFFFVRKEMPIIERKCFVNHSFSGFEN